ncbi:MAG TPA: NADP-dependent malic enzyme [Candidatus Brocadiia bacterium]|nr:NADP-dependent malic enzyme [Candidatus Brocadiia bacterium]
MKNAQKGPIELHRKYRGKIQIASKVPFPAHEYLAWWYTPGVAEACREIVRRPEAVYEMTNKGNTIGIINDGTRILGLGDIGPEAGLPVMEGKALLFKLFAGVDALPISLATKDVGEIVKTVKNLEPVLGGVCLEDVETPKCFDLYAKLEEMASYPIWHDDRHGTALVVLAALYGALKVVGKRLEDVAIVMLGAGSAGAGIVELLLAAGVKPEQLICCRSNGILCVGQNEGHDVHQRLARMTNPQRRTGDVAAALEGADVFIAASKSGGWLDGSILKGMRDDKIVFSLSNPIPEMPREAAMKAGARVYATGRSDMPNQANNVLGFPGVFRGALDTRADGINTEMILAAARGMFEYAAEQGLSEEFIIPLGTDLEVAPRVAAAVAKAACDTGIARNPVKPDSVAEHTRRLISAHQRIIAMLNADLASEEG